MNSLAVRILLGVHEISRNLTPMNNSDLEQKDRQEFRTRGTGRIHCWAARRRKARLDKKENRDGIAGWKTLQNQKKDQ